MRIDSENRPRATTLARAARREPLAAIGLLLILTVVAALAVTSLVLARLFTQQANAQLELSAPALMNLFRDTVLRKIDEPAERFQHVVHELVRVPLVAHCRIERLPAPDTTATSGDAQANATPDEKTPHSAARPAATHDSNVPPEAFEGGLRGGNKADRLVLKTELRDAAGRPRGRMEITFEPAQATALGGMLWTSAGLVGVVALVLVALIYRAALQRIRPITFVRDNLLAYHGGHEKSLELLAVQGATSLEGEAWNGLIASVQEIQRELDAHRTRQAVAGSMQLVHGQSSRMILDALPMGVLRIDAEDRLVYANQSASQLLGVTSAGDDNRLAARVGSAQLAAALLSLRQSLGGTGLDFRMEHGGGQTIVRLNPLFLKGAGEDELVVTVQDISQLKEAERSREEFLAHITHELRTPLTNIRAYTETLNENFFDDEQTRRECYNVIMSETRRLSKLVEDVLSASQIDAGVARLERVAVRLETSLRKAVQEVQASADARSIELSLKIPSKVPPVAGDRHRLHQVWINLIGNAIKYTPAGGSVTVDVQGEQGLMRVRISDTGIGIAPDNHEKIFEKFFRVHDPRVEAEQGTGLGLAITREIVRLHGGSIRVESEPGAGSTFIVELPLARDAELGEETQAAAAANR